MKKFKFRYLGVFALSALALIGCTDNAEEIGRASCRERV